MNDPDQTITFSASDNRVQPADPWTADDFTTDPEYRTVDRAAAFTNLGFITAALKRKAWVWCAIAVFGLLVGYGMYTKYPPAYQATTSVLLTNNPNLDVTQIQTDATLAQSTAVAGSVVNQLGLHESVAGFISSYTVTPVGEQVLVLTVGAPSNNEAIRRANALAANFLQFRAKMLQAQQQLETSLLNQQISQARQQLISLDKQISQVSAQPTSGSQQANLKKLQAQRNDASDTLTATQAKAIDTLATTQLITAAMVKSSQILNAATVTPHGFKTSKAFYLAVALIGGLAIGIIVVIIGALVSDRLRRRDDIAEAIGAPVRLSVGPVGGKRWLPRLGKRAARRTLDLTRITAHLRSVLPPNSRGPRCLAVVALDNAEVVARAVVSLASSSASQGKRVVVADLSDGTHAARLLGVKRPGVHEVSAKDADLVVAIPDRDDIAPAGPLASRASQADHLQVNPQLATAYDSANLLLTLATLNPAAGGDHLATWTTDVVVVVTCGQSSSTRIRAAGEMIRLAGTRLVSVIVVGADKSDESLGIMDSMDQSGSVMPL